MMARLCDLYLQLILKFSEYIVAKNINMANLITSILVNPSHSLTLTDKLKLSDVSGLGYNTLHVLSGRVESTHDKQSRCNKKYKCFHDIAFDQTRAFLISESCACSLVSRSYKKLLIFKSVILVI